MQDQPQQFEYMQPEGGAPETAPATESPSGQNKKLLIVIGTVVLVIAVILVVVYLKQRSRESKQLERAEEVQMQTNVNVGLSQCDGVEDEEKCKKAVRAELAQDSGNDMYCAGLVGDLYDNCVGLAAITSVDGAACAKISNVEKRDACADTVLAAVDKSQRTYETCSGFSNESAQADCQAAWVLDKILAGDCLSEHISEEECTYGELISDAIGKQDPDLCQIVPNQDFVDQCLGLVLPGDRDFDGVDAAEEEYQGTDDRNPDSDGDGLKDGEELYNYHTDPLNPDSDNDGLNDSNEIIVWFTNPLNPDTDGDSFLDGTEVDGGYNPLGSGTL